MTVRIGVLLGNVGSLIAFRVGVRDAKILADEFFPEFSVEGSGEPASRTRLPPAHGRRGGVAGFSAVTVPAIDETLGDAIHRTAGAIWLLTT